MKVAEKPQPIKFSDIMGNEMLKELRSIALCLAEAAVTTCKLDTPFI
jgi:hypothetical protein